MLKIYCISVLQCWILSILCVLLGSLFYFFFLSCPSAQVEVKTADIMVTIPEYYEGKNVLITGATGFVGKVQCGLNMHSTDTAETLRAKSKPTARVVIVFPRFSKGVAALLFNHFKSRFTLHTFIQSLLKGSSRYKHNFLLFNDSAVGKRNAKLQAGWVFIVKGVPLTCCY